MHLFATLAQKFIPRFILLDLPICVQIVKSTPRIRSTHRQAIFASNTNWSGQALSMVRPSITTSNRLAWGLLIWDVLMDAVERSRKCRLAKLVGLMR
jgi:hypothetical protein